MFNKPNFITCYSDTMDEDSDDKDSKRWEKVA